MKVLVTGARGFLGRYVVDQLVQSRINTVVVGRYLPENISSTDFIQLDLIGQVNFQELVDRAEATHLLHLAWYAEHGKFWTSPLNLRWTEATVRLTEAFCLAGGKKVVTAGTCAEYDWSYGYCREDNTPLNPCTLYGTAKDAARRLTIAVCAQHHVPCAWGRIFLPYGQGEDSHAFVRLLQSEAEGAYNLCSGQPTQIAEIVRLIASSFNAEAENVLNLSAERPGEPTLLVGDNHKLKALGWQQNNSLASILGVV